jgi:hypothetical protein
MTTYGLAYVQNNGISAAVVAGTSNQISGLRVEDTTKTVIVQDTYNAQYNHFVEQYNNINNRIEDKYLCTLPCWNLPRCDSCMCCGCCNFFLLFSFILFGILPYTSYITFTILSMMLVTQIITVQNVRYNRKYVPNPFARMIYAGNMKLSHINTYLKFTAYHELTSFLGVAASTAEASLLLVMAEKRIAQGESVTIMFYNDCFRNREKNVLNGICCRMCCTIILILISFVGVLISSALSAGLLIEFEAEN